MSERPAITITQEDYDRLSSLLEQQSPENETAEELEYELARATLMPSSEIPDDVVTMNSVVRFANEDDHVEHELKLVYPQPELKRLAYRFSLPPERPCWA